MSSIESCQRHDEESASPGNRLESQFSKICLQRRTGTFVTKPRIECINETFDSTRHPDIDDNDEEDFSDDPPDIVLNPKTLSNFGKDAFDGSNTRKEQSRYMAIQAVPVEGLSLMEQMIKEGLEAKLIMEKEKMKENRKQSKKKEAFGSLRKGFLSNNKNDNHVPVPTFKIKPVDTRNEIPVLRPNATSTNKNPLLLPEVQQEMDNQVRGMTQILSDSSQWMTPSLLDKISKNPKLCTAMTNPTFTSILNAMFQNPKATTEALKQSQPEMLQLMREFCELLGDHFTLLGQEQEECKQNSVLTSSIESKSKSCKPDNKTGIHPSHQPWTKKEHEQIQAILQDEYLTKLLMDPKMKHAIQECSNTPGKLKQYMQHPTYGPQLRKMIDAGLLQIQEKYE